MYIDTHFHLFLDKNYYEQSLDNLIKECIESGVGKMLLASTDKKDILKNIKFAKKYPTHIKVWLGFHPENYKEFDMKFLEKTIKENSEIICGIGEIGIDLEVNGSETLKTQQKVFEKQIELALKYNLPFAVHSRNSVEQTLEVLQKYTDLKFIWHCYNLDIKKTKYLLKKFKNIYFAFNSILSYKSGKYLEDSLKIIPVQKILCETDAPFLAPRPFKYKSNTPLGVISVYNNIKNILGINLEKQIEKNYKNICPKKA